MTYEGWGSPNKRDSDDVEPFFQPIENETLTIERIEVWQMDVDDEREEKPKRRITSWRKWTGQRL